MAIKVLAVDDSAADLANLKTILEEAGCQVVTATGGADGVAKAKAEKPAIIFLDIVMPDVDGYEACRQLAQDSASQSIPVVFVTSKGQKADKVWGELQGAKGYVTKPYSADQIIDQLKSLA